MKLIFLDFDGVLNCTGSFLLMQSKSESKEDKGYNWWVAAPNPVSVNLVQRLLNMPDVYCVISSSWRIGRNLDQIKEIMITDFGFTNVDKVINITPSLGRKRGYEIQDYLNQYQSDCRHYCIIDDDSDMLDSQIDNFVKTDYDIGFSFLEFQKVMKILNIKESILII